MSKALDHRPSQYDRKRSVQRVFPSAEGWIVEGSDAGRPTVHATMKAAVEAAETAIRARGGELRIQMNGRWKRGFALGAEAFTRISAVEGIKPSDEAMNRSREFDRKGLSSSERRQAIIAAYSRKR